jgi:hypothetical protein
VSNASLPTPDGYSGGRWGAGAHGVGEGLDAPVFVALEHPYVIAPSGPGYVAEAALYAPSPEPYKPS